MATANLFCAPLNQIAEAVITSVPEKEEYYASWYNGENLIHQVKFSDVHNIDELKARFAIHNEVNQPVVTEAEVNSKKEEMDNILAQL